VRLILIAFDLCIFKQLFPFSSKRKFGSGRRAGQRRRAEGVPVVPRHAGPLGGGPVGAQRRRQRPRCFSRQAE